MVLRFSSWIGGDRDAICSATPGVTLKRCVCCAEDVIAYQIPAINHLSERATIASTHGLGSVRNWHQALHDLCRIFLI